MPSRIRIGAVVVSLLAIPAGIPAATWNVSNLPGSNCSDTGSGTALRPFCSLQLGVNRAAPGDTVLVAGGTYGPAQLDVTASGTALAPIVIRSSPRRSAVIMGAPGAGDAAGGGVVITGSRVVFEGFEVRDAAGTGIRNWGNHVTIRDNYVHDNARRCDPAVIPKCGQGIASNGTSPRVGVVIERNLSVRNGTSTSQDHGFYISNPGAVIRNNVSVASSGFGFQIYPDCDGCLLYNNVAWGNGANSGFLIGGDGSANFSTGVVAANNISSGNAGYGFTIYRNGVEAVTMRHNIVHANAAGSLRLLNSVAPLVVETIEADPQLSDPARLDFHIGAASPAIDRGDPSLVPPDDIDGQARVMGAAVDIGADEALAGPPPEVGADLGFVSPTTMTWTGSPEAAVYEVYRGTLDSGGWTWDHACLAAGVPAAPFADAAIPAPGSGWYYLVAGVNAAGKGPLGAASDGDPRPAGVPCQ